MQARAFLHLHFLADSSSFFLFPSKRTLARGERGVKKEKEEKGGEKGWIFLECEAKPYLSVTVFLFMNRNFKNRIFKYKSFKNKNW